MSWGIRITILYLGFVALILTLMFTCFGHKTELEYTDYYAREIHFQKQIDARNNAEQLTRPIEYSVDQQSVKILLPPELLSQDLSGNVNFLRPSDSSKDKTFELKLNEKGEQVLAGFDKGVYKMNLSFSSQGKDYFKEAIITFR